MKMIVWVVCILSLLMVAGAALAAPDAKVTKAFACPKCEVSAMKAGKCACGEAMVAVKGRLAYVCKHCVTSSTKPGNCRKCGSKMEKSLITHACEACKVSSAKPGACKMCSAPLKKHILPMHG